MKTLCLPFNRSIQFADAAIFIVYCLIDFVVSLMLFVITSVHFLMHNFGTIIPRLRQQKREYHAVVLPRNKTTMQTDGEMQSMTLGQELLRVHLFHFQVSLVVVHLKENYTTCNSFIPLKFTYVLLCSLIVFNRLVFLGVHTIIKYGSLIGIRSLIIILISPSPGC